VTATFRPLTVTAVERDTDDSVTVTFDAGAEPMPFRHGQHLTLRRYFEGVEVRRNYSICSPAGGPLRVAIRRVPEGAFSTWAVDALTTGERIEALSPTGHFTHDLDPGSRRRYALLAAGSGITPLLSIASTILAEEPHSTIALLFVNRSVRTTMLLEDVEALRDRYLGRLDLAYAFTREPAHADVLSGRPDRARLDELVARGFLPANVAHAFLCGPKDLVHNARDALIGAGLAPEHIHRELFTSAQLGTARRPPPRPVDTSMDVVATGSVTIRGRTSAFEIYEGDTVLDAVQRTRSDAPFSCRSGVCSTCQARIVSGSVQMAVNYSLEREDLDRGLVLTCQSLPTSDTIVVDYDV